MARASVEGIELHYEDRGSGPPLVFLHGWAANASVWEAQVVELAARHRCITLDWRGCGRSEHPADGNTFAQNAADVLALLAQLGVREPTLVGSSLGGDIALHAAVREPAAIGAVVAIGALGHHLSRNVDRRIVLEASAELRRDRPRALHAMMNTWFVPESSSELRAWMAAQCLRSGWFVDELIHEASREDLRNRLAKLDVPVTVLHGRRDAEVPIRVAEETAAAARHGTLAVLEEAGHLPHLELPDALTQALESVL